MNLINWLGVGTVAATKNTDTKEIMVHMPSASPTADGRTVAQVEEKSEEAVNANGETIKVTTLVSNTKPAKWNSFGEPNRLTAPDVREGTPVSLYQVGGQNTIYWTTNGFSADTHRLETIVWGFQSNPNIEDGAEFNVDNFYTITVDTRSGFMGIRTSKSNGEKSEFEVKIDGGNGRVEVVGSNQSVLIMDDEESKFTYANKFETYVTVDKKKIALIAPDSILLNATNTINVKTKDLNIEALNIKVKATQMDVVIPTTNWEGIVNLTGNLVHVGNLLQTGNTISSGIVQGMTGVMTGIVNMDTHTHSGVDRGQGSTDGPTPTPIDI